MQTTSEAAPRHRHARGHKPLTVSCQSAQQILDVGQTKFWSLVKDGKIKLVEVGRRRMVVYASLEALAESEVA